MQAIDKFLKRKRSGFSGLIMLSTTAICAVALIFVVIFMQASTARSVAESVEHTIALECLSSCYVNNNDNQTWTSNAIFKPLTAEGNAINPLEEFNQAMTTYGLMGKGGNEQILMKYTKDGSSPTFELQIYGWNCLEAVWSKAIPITPNMAKVVIEDVYQPTV